MEAGTTVGLASRRRRGSRGAARRYGRVLRAVGASGRQTDLLAEPAGALLVLPTYVRPRPAAAVAMDPRVPHTIDEGLAPAPCLYYVHTSLCSSAEGRPACEAIESRLTLTPVARVSLPARPSRESIPYDSDPVETVIARVERVLGG